MADAVGIELGFAGGEQHADPMPGVRVTAMVKFYDRSRGFGFVLAPPGGPDAILHAATLRKAGLADPMQGDRLVCVIGLGSRGLQVVEILQVDQPLAGQDNPAEEAVRVQGRVKFYDPARGFGFVRTDSGEDVFVGAKLLRRLRLTALRDDQAVMVTASRGSRGLVAETLTFVSG